MTDGQIDSIRKRAQEYLQEATPEDSESNVARIPHIARLVSTRIVLCIYLLVVGGAGLVFVYRGLTATDWAASGNLLLELIKIAVIPIATLVLGYYFGSSER